jgi:hypothetical protein
MHSQGVVQEFVTSFRSPQKDSQLTNASHRPTASGGGGEIGLMGRKSGVAGEGGGGGFGWSGGCVVQRCFLGSRRL